jgi:hypothetical protein
LEYRIKEMTEMTRDEKIIRNKVGVLELARQLGSVSQACRIMGYGATIKVAVERQSR